GASHPPGTPAAHLAGCAARVDTAGRPGASPASACATRAAVGGAGGAAAALAGGAGTAGQLWPAIGGDGVPHRYSGRTSERGDRAGRATAAAAGGPRAGAGQRLCAKEPSAPAGAASPRAAARRTGSKRTGRGTPAGPSRAVP